MHTPATALNAPRSALALCAAAALLAGCGGGGGGGGGSTGTGGAPSAPTNASPGGIWNGTDQATGLALLGLVTESGEFHFIRSDDTQYFGTLSGTVQARASLTGCVLNGAITLIDANYNAYRVEDSFSGCHTACARLNGTTARGLGTLDIATTPNRAVIGVVNAGAGYSLAGAYPRI